MLNYADSFTYTVAGAVSLVQLGNGRWESTTFNSRVQPTQIALGTVQNGTDKLKLNFDYGATTNNGNVQSQTITVPTTGQAAGFTAVQTYTYDSLNRLKDAKENIDGNQTPAWKQTFTFDRFGNRNFDTANTTTLGSCPVNVCNPTVNQSNNRLSGYGYDSAGNTTTDPQGRSFTYDGENKQTKVMNGSQTVGEYFYDGDGKRIKKKTYSGGVLTEETIFVYDAGGKLVAEYSNQTSATLQVSYLTADHLGSPRINTDANGNILARHDFMPFGEEITSAQTAQRNTNLHYGQDAVRQKFTGYIKDDETGLDFAEARMYANQLGRFTSPDYFANDTSVSDPQSWNLYAYVRNNPLYYTDRSGKEIYIAINELGRDRQVVEFKISDRKGKLYYLDGSEYNGNNEATKVISDHLNSLLSNSSVGGVIQLLGNSGYHQFGGEIDNRGFDPISESSTRATDDDPSSTTSGILLNTTDEGKEATKIAIGVEVLSAYYITDGGDYQNDAEYAEKRMQFEQTVRNRETPTSNSGRSIPENIGKGFADRVEEPKTPDILKQTPPPIKPAPTPKIKIP